MARKRKPKETTVSVTPEQEEVIEAVVDAVNEGAAPEEELHVEEETVGGRKRKRIKGTRRAFARARRKLGDTKTIQKLIARLSTIKSKYAGKTIGGYKYKGVRLRHNNPNMNVEKYRTVMNKVWRDYINPAIKKDYKVNSFKELMRKQ